MAIVIKREATEHFISALAVKKLMRASRRLSRQIDKRLEALPPGWSLASYDPNLLFDAFPNLRLRDGFQLAAYQFYEGGNGNGFVFAIPESRSLPDPQEGFSFDWSSVGTPVFRSKEQPLPEWVNSDIGYFLEGDGSPLSYFQSSVFIRELQEMGSLWHGCSWSTHEVLTSVTQIAKQKWEWQEKKPRDWRPVVRQNSAGLQQVIFNSHTGLGQEQIVVHKDTFTAGYKFDMDDKVIALGEGGYVF
jgi:hypothetical protein